MKNLSNLRFCIIGGRAFGKSQLVTSLIRIAGRTDGVVVPANRSQRGIIRMQKILDAGDNIEGTSWDDVRDFQFRIVKREVPAQTDLQGTSSPENREWNISFTDYPGELFEKYIDSETDESQKTEDGISMDHQTAKMAKALMKRMESSDGLIILLPRNVHEYNDILRIYLDRLGDFLTKVLDKRPNLPVCLAINKCDMYDEPDSELEKLLSKDRAFSHIFNTVQGLCKNTFHLPVSAFGKHAKDDSGKWDKDSNPTPRNVLEMLFELASRAEANRIAELAAGWEGASGFSRTFVWPWKSLSVCRKGFTLDADREKAASIHHRALGRFLGAVASIVVVGFATWTVCEAVREYSRFSRNDKRLTTYEGSQFPNLSKEILFQQKNDLLDSSWIDKVFFPQKQASLQNRWDALETNFNEAVFTNLLATLQDDDYRDKDTWELSTDDRRARSIRRQERITTEQNRLTDEATQLRDCDTLVDKEQSFFASLNENSPFYDDLFNVLKRPEDMSEKDWNHRLPRMIKSIQDKHVEKKNTREDDWKKLDDLRAQAEGISSNELAKALSDIANGYPSPEWRGEVAKTKEMIEAIVSAREWFAESSPVLASFEAQRSEWAVTNAYWTLYGPFDDDVKTLRSLRDSGKVGAILQFIASHPKDAFPDRAIVFEEIERDKIRLVSGVMTAFRKSVETNKDGETDSYAIRISKANNRIEAADRALAELPTSGLEFQEVVSTKEEAKQFVRDNLQNVAFEGFAKQELETGSIRSMWALLRDQKWKNETAYALLSDKLRSRVGELEQNRTNDLDAALADPNLQDDSGMQMEERIRRRNERAVLYEEALRDFAENTDAFESTKRKIEEIKAWISNHERYVGFDRECSAIPQGPARLRGLVAFLGSHNETTFPEYGKRIANLQAERNTLETSVKEDLYRALSDSAFQDDEAASMEKRIERKHGIIQECDKALAIAAEGSMLYNDILDRKTSEETWIANHTGYSKFDSDYVAIPAGQLRARRLESFLKTYVTADYPEYETRINECREELNGLETNACERVMVRLEENRKNAESGSWKAQVANAQKNIAVLEECKNILPERCGPWLDELIIEENMRIEGLTKRGTFLDDYKAVVDNSDTNQWLKAIADFSQTHHGKDYPEQANEFSALDLMKTAAEDSFIHEYDAFGKKLGEPLPRDFEKWSLRHQLLADKADEIKQRCPTDSHLFDRFSELELKNRLESGTFAKWDKVQHRASDIETEALKEDANTRDILMLVQEFLRDFSKTNTVYARPELEEDYRKVETVCTTMEQKWAHELDGEMIGLAPREIVELLNDSLSVFRPGSVLHQTYKTKRDELSRQISDKAEQDAFVAAAKRCLERIDGNQLSADNVIAEINGFSSTNPKVPQGSSEAMRLVAALNNKLTAAQREKLWQEASAPANRLIAQGVPPTDNVKDLKRFKGECTKEEANLEHLDDARKVNLIGQLDVLIRQVENRIGDGTFKKIEDTEKTYKENPSDENARRFSDLLDSFDPNQPGNADKEDKVGEMKKKFNEDRHLLKNAKKTFAGFLREPSRNAFIGFKDAANELRSFNAEYGARHPEIGKCRKFLEQVGWGDSDACSFDCRFVEFDVRDSHWRDFGSQSRQHFIVAVNGEQKFEKEKIKKEHGSIDAGPASQFRITIYPSRGTDALLFVIKDIKFGDDIEDKATLDFYELLAQGINNGVAKRTLLLRGNVNWVEIKKPKRDASFVFEFSGLPTLSLE